MSKRSELMVCCFWAAGIGCFLSQIIISIIFYESPSLQLEAIAGFSAAACFMLLNAILVVAVNICRKG